MRVLPDRIVCEMFEVSIPNKEVLACSGKLRRSFPGVTVSFERSHLSNKAFCTELASVLSQMNVDELDESSAHTKKAGSVLKEIRDPPSPHLITDWLAGVLAALGGGLEVPATSVTKRIADDVLWKSALKPWRRSQVWLVLRVVMQTTLERAEYKSFMLYMMASILEKASDSSLKSDLLLCMRTKIARRAVKLDTSDRVPVFVQEKVFLSNKRAEALMNRRWKEIRKNYDRVEPLVAWDPTSLDFSADAHVKLLKSTPHIAKVLCRAGSHSKSSFHVPKHAQRLCHLPDLDSMLRRRLQEEGENIRLDLADFENAARDGLKQWTRDHMDDATVPCLLRQTIYDYYIIASSAYKGNPEDMSFMILLILELWAALDKVVVSQCPLLALYPPEVSESLLESLLLRKREDLIRIPPLVRYLRHRRNHSRRPSVFGPLCDESFAAKFFESSTKMQKLKSTIERDAAATKQRKILELRQKNDEYHSLMNKAMRQSHDHPWVQNWRGRGYYSKRDCEKCHLTQEVCWHWHSFPYTTDGVNLPL